MKSLRHDFISIIECLKSLSCAEWAYHVLYEAVSILGLTPALAIECLKFISGDLNLNIDFDTDHPLAEDYLMKQVEYFQPLQRSEFLFVLSWIKFKQSNMKLALKHLFDAQKVLEDSQLQTQEDKKKAVKLNDMHNWNASHSSSKSAIRYWLASLDYGLRTPAKGSQKWQRALPKPFTGEQIPLWRGTSLSGKSILLLEEQAIGDVMQFLTLIPDIIEEAAKTSILVSDRLFAIYCRSFDQYVQSGKRYFLFSRCSAWQT